jgi:hypothetical protein
MDDIHVLLLLEASTFVRHSQVERSRRSKQGLRKSMEISKTFLVLQKRRWWVVGSKKQNPPGENSDLTMDGPGRMNGNRSR